MELLNKAAGFARKSLSVAKLKIKQNAPEICLAGNIIFSVASVVLAVRATRKMDDECIVEETHELLNQLDRDEDSKRADYAKVYLHQGGKVAKLYAPSVACLGASIACGVVTHNTLQTRVERITGAYTALQTAYDAYRARTRQLIGPEAEQRLADSAFPIKKGDSIGVDMEGEDVRADEDGYIAVGDCDPRVFHYNRYTAFPTWVSYPNGIRSTLERIQRNCQGMKDANGFIMLSEVLDQLGIERTEESLIMGWLDDGLGNKDVDFGLGEYFYPMYSIDTNTILKDVILHFNCDWVVTDKTRKPGRVFKK